MATILDVAKKAGVSRSTVSRVLTNSKRVDPETKQRILAAMKELGYKPSRAAQTLRNNKTKLIAVLVPRISNNYYAALLQGMEREVAGHDYQVILCNTENDSKKELQYLKMLENNQVDGIVLTTFRNPNETVKKFAAFGPIILVGEYHDGNLFFSVSVNHQEAAYQAVEHLIKLGHKKIGMINGPKESVISRDREKGFREALEFYDIPVNEKWVLFDSFGIQQGKRYMKELLNTNDYPTAVFAGNDELAVGVIQEAKKQGLEVPKDLAVVGFDDQEMATVIEPNLTTVKQPIEQLGEKAAALIIDILQEKQEVSKRTVLETTLLIRESCGMKENKN
ncbi:LacI family DNA-binding transcriptional regulator [Bacillus taeanensis]|uniref:LacI family transcriptional regulator n=1 Tax=Bacillus taeanensis TaxID=273032 RepID=A0A366XQK3_9BACI|nr:LacI family DNA-binding transcriptional regulator [Bacillus taeanensis]RBW68207.1 LacI family transcriptional regulator [Bacillus taeanensis]